jgi:hypothetical protein
VPARLFAGAVGIATLALAVPASAQLYTFDRSFAPGTVVRLDISTHHGDVVVTASDDGRVVISGTASVRSGFNMPLNAGQLASSVADHPPIQLKGTTLEIRPPGDPLVDRGVAVRYEIRVPAPTPVVIVNDSGSVAIRAIAAAVTVHTQSGAIDATLPADAGVSLDASSESGLVDVDRGLVDGAVDKSRAKGSIRGGGPPWVLATKHGEIHVRTPAGKVDR